MRYFKILSLLFVFLFASNTWAFDVSQYNVVWKSQSRNSGESMPCGGGSIGLNVWVENNEVLFYLSRSGAFDENNVFPKFGRVRLSMTPNPFEGASFRQELKLQEGYVEIETVKSGKRMVVSIWVDVFRPVVHVEVNGNQPTTLTATYENWRTEDLVWEEEGRTRASIAYRKAPMKATVFADSIAFDGNERVQWYHRNRQKTLFDVTVNQQQLDPVKSALWNPLSYLTFGGYMQGKGMKPAEIVEGKYASTAFKGWQLKSDKSRPSHCLEIGLHIGQTPTLHEWFAGLEQLRRDAVIDSNTKAKTRAWWRAFWQRSHISINSKQANPADSAWQAGRNYQLFRYQLGCNAYGTYPTKFNGGLFTYDPEYVKPDAPFTPDHRDWGGGTHTQQNQRLVYFMMNKSGDSDMLPAQLDFYERARGNAEVRTKHYWGHNGACFTEQLELFGLPMAASYGWSRPEWLHPGIQDNAWLEYEWDTQLEFCLMALDMYHYHNTDISRYIPLIESCLNFFYEHYQWEAKQRSSRIWDEQGKLIIYPGSGAETFKLAYNPANTIGALTTVTAKLLALPDRYLPEGRRSYWTEFQKRIPSLPMKYIEGKKVISPAETWARINNIEMPQFYPIYPWGLFGIGLPDLDIALNTWQVGKVIDPSLKYISWHQDGIFCARMGLTSEAAEVMLKKLADAPRRFPTFWGPGHDWVPDHNWGGSGMINLQEMVMQTPTDNKIYLLPAFPFKWDVDFKLYAPKQTVVEVSYRNGKIEQLKVTPEERMKDVVLPAHLNNN